MREFCGRVASVAPTSASHGVGGCGLFYVFLLFWVWHMKIGDFTAIATHRGLSLETPVACAAFRILCIHKRTFCWTRVSSLGSWDSACGEFCSVWRRVTWLLALVFLVLPLGGVERRDGCRQAFSAERYLYIAVDRLCWLVRGRCKSWRAEGPRFLRRFLEQRISACQPVLSRTRVKTVVPQSRCGPEEALFKKTREQGDARLDPQQSLAPFISTTII